MKALIARGMIPTHRDKQNDCSPQRVRRGRKRGGYDKTRGCGVAGGGF